MILARILVVDDNPTNLKLISHFLSHEGHAILQASSGEQAMRLIQTHQVDMVLMDVGLPGIDGLTLTRQLRADPKTRRLIIIAVTAFAMEKDGQNARDAGCDDYLSKPIDLSTLSDLVQMHLEGKAAERAKRALRVLVVEDTQSELKLVKHVLQGEGFHVNEAGTGGEALESMKQSKPGLILMDMMLPDTDGVSLAREVRANAETRDIPIIAVTSYPDQFPRSMMLSEGCDGYIIKPLDTNLLPHQVRSALEPKLGATIERF